MSQTLQLGLVTANNKDNSNKRKDTVLIQLVTNRSEQEGKQYSRVYFEDLVWLLDLLYMHAPYVRYKNNNVNY